VASAAFLPPLVNCNGQWDQVLAGLYTVFVTDLKRHKSAHDGKGIMYDSRIGLDGKEEAFWHLVQKDDPAAGGRTFDPSRSEKLPWLRPTAETADSSITVFDYDSGNSKKGVRRYLWIESSDYVVVLKHQKNVFFLITAYHVDAGGARKLSKHYRNRVTP